MIQGPLLPDWSSRKFGVIPRIENGDITLGRPMTMRRFQLWMNAGVHVAGRPDSVFIKLHTHGCKDGNIDEWLGPNIAAFHHELAAYRRRHPNLRLHYVTAWEMAQQVKRLQRQGNALSGVGAASDTRGSRATRLTSADCAGPATK